MKFQLDSGVSIYNRARMFLSSWLYCAVKVVEHLRPGSLGLDPKSTLTLSFRMGFSTSSACDLVENFPFLALLWFRPYTAIHTHTVTKTSRPLSAGDGAYRLVQPCLLHFNRIKLITMQLCFKFNCTGVDVKIK